MVNPLLVMDAGLLEHLAESHPPIGPILKARALRLKTYYPEALMALKGYSPDDPIYCLFAEAERLYLLWRQAEVTDEFLKEIRKFRKKVIQHPLSEEESLFLTGIAYNIEANTLSDLGHLYKSIDVYQKALEIFLMLENQYFINLLINNLGYSFYQVGAFSLAKANLERLLEHEQQPLDLARTCSNLALVERSLGNLERAVELFQKANRIQLQLNAVREASYTFFELFRTFLKKKDVPQMTVTLKQFSLIADRSDQLSVGRLEICKALVLLNDENLENKITAIEWLIKVFWESPIFTLKFQVILYIVEEIISYPQEFVKERDTLIQISEIINHLYLEGLKDQSSLKFVLLNIIQAALKLIEGDVISATAIVKDCQGIIKKEGYPFIQPLLDEIQTAIDVIKFDQTNMPETFHGYLVNVTNALSEERMSFSVEKPRGFAIYQNGEMVGVLNFDGSDIREIAEKIFPFQEPIRSLDEVTYALKRTVNPFTLLYVAEGDPFISKLKMDHLKKLITELIETGKEWDIQTALHSSKAILLTSI